MIFWAGLHENHKGIEIAKANMCPKYNNNIVIVISKTTHRGHFWSEISTQWQHSSFASKRV